MVSFVNSHTNVTSKRWYLWEIDSRFALKSIPWSRCVGSWDGEGGEGARARCGRVGSGVQPSPK